MFSQIFWKPYSLNRLLMIPYAEPSSGLPIDKSVTSMPGCSEQKTWKIYFCRKALIHEKFADVAAKNKPLSLSTFCQLLSPNWNIKVMLYWSIGAVPPDICFATRSCVPGPGDQISSGSCPRSLVLGKCRRREIYCKANIGCLHWHHKGQKG